jgi:cell division protein FtsZ
MIDNKSPVIEILGVGGAGINIVSGILNYNSRVNAEFIVIDTDLEVLNNSTVKNKIFLDVMPFKKGSCGFSASKLKSAYTVSLDMIGEAVRVASHVVLLGGLGGMTGSGVVPLMASFLKEKALPAIGIFTTPFPFEGKMRMTKAEEAILSLKNCLRTFLIFPNQSILNIVGKNIAIRDIFKSSDELLSHIVYSLVKAFLFPRTCRSMGFKQMMLIENAGVGYIGIGKGSGENRAMEALNAAIQLIGEHRYVRAKRACLLLKAIMNCVSIRFSKHMVILSRSQILRPISVLRF